MNLIDQSVEQIDFALRRRFAWHLSSFDSEVLIEVLEEKWNAIDTGNNDWDRVGDDFDRLVSAAERLNQAISNSPLLGPDYEIGHTYYFDLVPLLKEDLGPRLTTRSTYLWTGSGAPRAAVKQLWNMSLGPLLEQYLAGLRAEERDEEISRLHGTFLSRGNR